MTTGPDTYEATFSGQVRVELDAGEVYDFQISLDCTFELGDHWWCQGWFRIGGPDKFVGRDARPADVCFRARTLRDGINMMSEQLSIGIDDSAKGVLS